MALEGALLTRIRGISDKAKVMLFTEDTKVDADGARY